MKDSETRRHGDTENEKQVTPWVTGYWKTKEAEEALAAQAARKLSASPRLRVSASFYSTPQSQLALLAAARAWLGTPFVPHAAIRGAGVDCVHLCGALYIETGAITKFDPPRYSIDAAPHSELSLIAAWAARSGRFAEVHPAPLSASPCLPVSASSLPGDTLSFRIGRRDYHTGIQITPHTFIHCARGHGVIESSLQDPTYSKRLLALYRPLPLSHGLTVSRSHSLPPTP